MADPSLSALAANATEAAQPLTQGTAGEYLAPIAKAANATAESVQQLGVATGEALNLPPAAPLPGTDLWGNYFQSLGAVFLLLGLLALGFYLLKRFGPKAGFRGFQRGSLRLEAQLPLGPRRSVCVVRFLNKHLVLGVTDSQINLLTTMEVDDGTENKDFSAQLAAAQKPDADP